MVVVDVIDMTTNTTMNTSCAPTMTLLMPATWLMPTTLSTVTRAMEATTNIQAGISGKAMFMNRPMSR